MRLFLAVAVLMLAFIAHTEAQDAETLEQKFAQFTQQLNDLRNKVTEDTKTAFENIGNSQPAREFMDFFDKLGQRMKTAVENAMPQQ